MVRSTTGLRLVGPVGQAGSSGRPDCPDSPDGPGMPPRLFMSRWFSREARNLGIGDLELVRAAGQIRLRQGDDLGGGVWKKRVNCNRDRAIVLVRGGRHFFFVHAFSKSAVDNIRCDEVREFKRLAAIYAGQDAAQLASMLAAGLLIEVKT